MVPEMLQLLCRNLTGFIFFIHTNKATSDPFVSHDSLKVLQPFIVELYIGFKPCSPGH